MSHPSAVKELAYSLDPECWISYSGKPKEFKQRMEIRRATSMHKASEAIYEADVRHEREERIAALEPKAKLAITMIDKAAQLMKSGKITIENVEMTSSLDWVTLTVSLRRKT